ncbi:MAG: gliding motility-associated C-terminal domain-containing protein [Owenweeksia sp.]|nr:gliding motility-associated C-terminal domain-containing protein [Owenweeksia sp.]
MEVKDCDQVQLEMPNIFTPNNDGNNDILVPLKLLAFSQAQLALWRRGVPVSSSSGNNIAWDGKYNGRNCADGTYFWILKYTDQREKEHIVKGHLTLVR